MNIFDTVEKYTKTIPIHKKAFLFQQNKEFTEDLKTQISQLEIENTHYLHEAINIVELFVHKRYIIFCIYDKKVKNAINHLPHLTEAYNNIMLSTISKYGKREAQYVMTRLFNGLHIKGKRPALQDDFDTKLFSLLSSIREDNNDLIKQYGPHFDLQELLPFIDTKELDKKYNDFIDVYTDPRRTSLSDLSDKLQWKILASTSRSMRKYYGDIDHRFVYLNQFFHQSPYGSFENKENLQTLNKFMTELSQNKKNKILAEINALYTIQSYHNEAFEAAETGGYPAAEKYFNISEKIYEQYVNNAHPVFKEYYINIWAVRERNIGRSNFPDLSTRERSQIRKHMGAVLKKLESK